MLRPCRSYEAINIVSAFYSGTVPCKFFHQSFSCCAHQLFDGSPERDEFQLFDSPSSATTNTSLATNSQYQNFERIFANGTSTNDNSSGLGTKPRKYILCSALNFCVTERNWELGRQLHAEVLKSDLGENLFINSSLVNFYAKCGEIVDARSVFDGMKRRDLVSWTSIICGFTQNGYGGEAICLFKEMLRTRIRPNCFTYVSVISGCKELESTFECVVLLHTHVIKLGYENSTFVISSLIDCYSKCGRMDQAVLLFGASKNSDTIVLNSMISGYSRNLLGEEAMILFMEMRNMNVSLSERTLTSIFNACGSLTALQQGRQVHALAAKMGSDGNVFVVCALIDMYSKCGNIDEARRAFDQTAEKNGILWTTMIMGYAQSGRGSDGLELFEHLVTEERFVPDHICFTAVLTSCNHAGFLDKGVEYFEKMRRVYNLVPQIDQYACLVDLYARNGHLKKAKEVMERMPFNPNSVMWTSILGSCKVHGEIELGRLAAYELFKLEPHSVVPYLTLSSIYAGAGLWDEVREMKTLMKQKGVRKTAGWSWVEVEERNHIFSAGDLSHPRSQGIYVELERLNLEMRAVGYIPEQINVDFFDLTKPQFSTLQENDEFATIFCLQN